mgnify:FL=1|tara:strand:+ start:1031 stop:1261 length:231 start_codon:yes stop_codon:yes gene_type:complete
MLATRENIKHYASLISKKLRVEWTSDYVPTYYYDYKINIHETEKEFLFHIELKDLEKDFNDNDYDLIFHYVNKLKQ